MDLRLLSLICSICFIRAIPIEEFFPFGRSANDAVFSPNDDDSLGPLRLPLDFPYFDHNHRQIYLANNGLFSFLGPIRTYVPDAFPLGDDMRLIAGFWSDIDTRGNIADGNVVYYQIHSQETNSSVLEKAKSYIQRYYSLSGTFNPSLVIIGTWYRVGAYPEQTSSTNTFQIVLTTDGIRSFAFLLYHELQWSSPSENETDVGGQAGFNAGDGFIFEMLPYSRTNEVVLLSNLSNVGVPGLFIFRVDSDRIIEGGCNNNSLPEFYPRRGSQLGFTPVTVQGPCFDNFSPGDIKCRFGDSMVVDAIIINSIKAICLSPASSLPLIVQLYLSFDGGRIFQTSSRSFMYQPAEYGFSQNSVSELNVFHDDGMILSVGDSMSFRWSFSNERLNDWLNLDVFQYVQMCIVQFNISNQGLSFDSCQDITEGVEVGANDEQIFTSVPALNLNSLILVYFRIVVRDVTNNQTYAGLNSAIFTIRDTEQSAITFCNDWFLRQPEPTVWNQNLFLCPMTISQARVARCCYQPDPMCPDNVHEPQNNCKLRRGREEHGERSAVACYVSRSRNSMGAGSECCYDQSGQIITHGNGAGTDNRYEPLQSSVRHFFEDTLPFISCCHLNPNEEYCLKYFQARPTRQGSNTMTSDGGTWGDPHFTTLDGSSYTFNGYGEYTYLAISDSVNSANRSFTSIDQSLIYQSQVRMTPLITANTSFNGVTVIRGFAAKLNDPLAERVSVIVSRRQALIVIRGNETIELNSDYENSASNNQSIILYYPEMMIDYSRSNKILMLNWFIGVSVQLKQMWITSVDSNVQVLNLAVSLSGLYKNRTFGLLGVYDDDKRNDLQASNGQVVGSADDLTTEQIHKHFGQSWSIDSNHSLFYYESHDSATFYSNQSRIYQPIFSLPNSTENFTNTAFVVCNINSSIKNQSAWTMSQRTCFYDFIVTGDRSLAIESGKEATIHESNRLAQRNPPEFDRNLPLSMSISYGKEIMIKFHANSEYTNKIIYNLVKGPKTALLNQNTGVLRWQPTSLKDNNTLIFVTATDTTNNLIGSHELRITLMDDTIVQASSGRKISMIVSKWIMLMAIFFLFR